MPLTSTGFSDFRRRAQHAAQHEVWVILLMPSFSPLIHIVELNTQVKAKKTPQNATMCALCHAARKSKSLGSLLRSCQRSMVHPTGGALAVEAGTNNIAAFRAFSAVPQPSESSRKYVLDPATINPNILKAQYAVRGELYNKAVELAGQGRDIMYTNGERPTLALCAPAPGRW